ncbi:CAP domain-containing protein [Specibacter sp. RAF43]|uniref:CAP domain-containing protein n=1 Tax=Specibacter sp. RAF43 TaxID=3233057 RepID=UPI003F952019
MRTFLGLVMALAMSAALLVTGVAPAAAATPPPPADPYLAKILSATNVERALNGAGPLVWNTTIATGSQQWAVTLNDRANKGTLDMKKLHRTDAGLSILPKGADMYSEVIAFNTSAQETVDWWMRSPAHRAALLDKRATDMGAGHVKTTKADYHGLTLTVANLAGYAESRKHQPQPQPVPVVHEGDIAAVDTDGGLYIYPSAKGGDLWKRKFVSLGWAGTQQLEVADFNSDGLQDVIAVWKTGRLTVSYGQADGTLKALLTIGAGWAAYDIIAAKWKTTDKFPGLIAQQRTSGEVFYYPSPNGAGFSARTRIGIGFRPMKLVGVDFDLDGRVDIAARNAKGQLMLYRGNGSGGFVSETRKVIGTGWGGMTHLSGITNHLGTNAQGILARDGAGNLLHYPLHKNGFGARAQIGTGGWTPLLLGS